MFEHYTYVLLLAGLLILISIISSRFFSRFGLSSLLVTLGIGIMIGNGGGVDFDYNYPKETLKISEFALCIIIFAGGFESNWKSFRPVLWQSISLSTLGVFLTTIVVAAVVILVLDWSLAEGLLIGAIVSSTDAAAVFSVLENSGIKLKKGVSETLELESGTNDPMAWFLTISLCEYILNPATEIIDFVSYFFVSIAVGFLSGLLIGKLAHGLIKRLNLKRGQNPVVLIAIILILYSFNSIVAGSAFLSVYVAGIVLGNSPWTNRDFNRHFFEGSSWLMETILFLILGLQVYSYSLVDVIWEGLIISAILMLIARPVGTFVSLIFFRNKIFRKGLFLSWVGLRGATPIVFALIPVVKGVPGSDRLFDISFIVVIASILIQGTTVGLAARLTNQLEKGS